MNGGKNKMQVNNEYLGWYREASYIDWSSKNRLTHHFPPGVFSPEQEESIEEREKILSVIERENRRRVKRWGKCWKEKAKKQKKRKMERDRRRKRRIRCWKGVEKESKRREKERERREERRIERYKNRFDILKKIDVRKRNCGRPGKVLVDIRNSIGETVTYFCWLFFLCTCCAKKYFRKWVKVFRALLLYARDHRHKVVFFTLTQSPFADPGEGVDLTARRWRDFLRIRVVDIGDEEFEREFKKYEGDLKKFVSQEEITQKEMLTRLSKQRWAWRWWRLRIEFFSQGEEKALEVFKNRLTQDLNNNFLFGKDADKEVSNAFKAMKRWKKERDRIVKEVMAKYKGKSDKEIKKKIMTTLRDRFCRMGGCMPALVKRIEPKHSDSKDGSYYFHLHILAAVETPIPKLVLSILWAKVSGGNTVTHIREVRLNKDTNIDAYASKECKYSAKVGDDTFSDEELLNLQVAFYRRDMVDRGGWDRKKLREYIKQGDGEKDKDEDDKWLEYAGEIDRDSKGDLPHDLKKGDRLFSTVYHGKTREEYCWEVIDVLSHDRYRLSFIIDPNPIPSVLVLTFNFDSS